MISKVGASLIKESSKDNKSDKPSKLTAGSSTVAGLTGLGAAWVANKATTPMASPLLNHSGKDLTDAESDKLIKHFTKNRPTRELTKGELSSLFTDIKFRLNLYREKALKFGEPQNQAFSFYDPASHTVVSDKNSYIMAHELGHATGVMGKNRTLGNLVALFSHGPAIFKGLPVLAPVTEAMKGAESAYNKKMGIPDEENSTALSVATNVGRASTAAQLLEEGQATIRGLHAIGKIQGGKGILAAAKLFGPAYGTYAGAALGSHALAPYFGRLYGEHLAEKELKKRN